MASIISASTTSGTALNMSADTTGVLQLATGATPTTALTIDTSQNVGIGTTSPSTLLHTYTSAQESIRFARNSTASSAYVTFYANNASSAQVQYAGILGDVASSTAGSHGGNLLFYTTGSGTSAERMRIDSIGNVLVGTTSNSDANRINVVGVVGAATMGIRVGANAQGGINWYNGSGTYVASVIVNASSIAYNTTSDYRLKENIVPMTGALDKVALLKPVTYTWKEDGLAGQGFIAHELQAVVPDAVSGEKDAVETYTDEEGNEKTRPKYQGVDTSFLVATLTAAIQEQQTIINDLKARVTALEAK